MKKNAFNGQASCFAARFTVTGKDGNRPSFTQLGMFALFRGISHRFASGRSE
jgi:hypothetical protein